MNNENVINSKQCFTCKQEKPRILFTKKQWDRKKFKRCKECLKQPSSRPPPPPGSNKKKKKKEKKREEEEEEKKIENTSSKIDTSMNSNNYTKTDVIITDDQVVEESALLRRATRYFLTRNFQQAWETCNSYFTNTSKILEDEQEEKEEESPDSYVTIYVSVKQEEEDIDQIPIRISVYNNQEVDNDEGIASHRDGLFDQFVLIALQSWQELHNNDKDDYRKTTTTTEKKNEILIYDVSLRPLIQAMAKQSIKGRSISPTVFGIWIEFTKEAISFDKQLMKWNLLVIIQMLRCSEKNNNNKYCEELLISFLGNQLPLIQDSSVVCHLAENLFLLLISHCNHEEPPRPLELVELLKDQKLSSDSLEPSITAIIESSIWKEQDKLIDILSDDAWARIDSAWQPYMVNNNKTTAKLDGDNVSEENNDNVDLDQQIVCIPPPTRNPKSPSSYFSFLHHISSTTATGNTTTTSRWINKTLDWFRHRIRCTIQQLSVLRIAAEEAARTTTTTNSTSQNNWLLLKNKLSQQITLSLGLTLVAWRQRRILKLILSYLFVPIKELLEALKLFPSSE